MKHTVTIAIRLPSCCKPGVDNEGLNQTDRMPKQEKDPSGNIRGPMTFARGAPSGVLRELRGYIGYSI